MRRLLPAAGLVIAAAGALFVVRSLVRDWDQASDAIAGASPGWLAAAPLLAAAGMTAIAVPWADAVRLLGGAVERGRAVAWYFVGELGKYVPGGIWPVLGRGELLRKRGAVPGSVAYASVALSLVALYLAAMLVAVALLPFGLAGDDDPGPALWLLLLLPAGLLALHPRPLRLAVSVLEGLARRPLDVTLPRWPDAVRLVVSYTPAWALIAAATFSVARGLDPGAEPGRVALAAVVSWIAGFLAVPAPGGIGVREAVFTAAAGLDPGVGAATAVVARVVFMAVDAIGAAAGSVASSR